MRNLEILGIEIVDKDLAISLVGGDTNLAGTLYLWQDDSIKLHEMRRRVEKLMEGNVLVDLALSVSTGRWRLIGKNREIIGGVEPSKLIVNQTRPEAPPMNPWGLNAPCGDD